MSFKDQLEKIKDNWLLIALFVLGVLMMFFLISGTGFRGAATQSMGASKSLSYDGVSNGGYGGVYSEGYYPEQSTSLAPNILERIIIKTASMNVQVKDFPKAETDLKSYIKSNDAIVTSENVNTDYGKYKTGYYTINVPTGKYDALTGQLKGIGEVQSFNENANDITGSYVNLQDIISAEKSRLGSYEELYNSTSNIDEKIKLLDSIYSQKNNIKSLEYRLANEGEQVDYSQIHFTLQQKRPAQADVIFATFADLWSSFKASLNVMLYLIAYVLPFALLWLLIWGITRLFRKK